MIVFIVDAADRRRAAPPAGSCARRAARGSRDVLLPRFAPVSMAALLATLVLIFAFQAENITDEPLHVAADRGADL